MAWLELSASCQARELIYADITASSTIREFICVVTEAKLGSGSPFWHLKMTEHNSAAFRYGLSPVAPPGAMFFLNPFDNFAWICPLMESTCSFSYF